MDMNIFDLSKTERMILLRIVNKGGCSITTLFMEGVCAPMSYDIANNLVKKGLITIDKSRKSHILHLTPKGREMAEEIEELLKE